MRIISETRLREFWESRKGDSQASRRDLTIWRRTVRACQWRNFGELRMTFRSADSVGNCTVFNVGANRFRLIARVFFSKKKLYVLKIMDHEEYDRNMWPRECNCHRPPPMLNPPRLFD